MGKTTGISWANSTFNLWWGCTKVGGSPACDNCYAELWAKRTGFEIWGDDKERRYFGDKHWAEPAKWNQAAEKAGVRSRVFCMSMGDWAEGRPEQLQDLDRWWEICLNTPWLDKLMLTKRPQLITKLCPIKLPNIWHGVTAETQQWLDIRWRHLSAVDCEIKWLSMEPLFERITLPLDFLSRGKRSWVIVGGESGGHARPMNPDWARYLRDQCVEAGVPYFFKQWGEWVSVSEVEGSGPHYQFPEGNTVRRIGTKATGDLLDGCEWKQFPEVGR